MRQVEEGIKAGAGVEKSGDPDGSPVSHTFAKLLNNHMAPNWLCPNLSHYASFLVTVPFFFY